MRHSIVIILLLVSWMVCAQNVSNVTVQQKGEKIEVAYTLDKEADVYLCVIIEGQYKPCRSVSGEIGQNVAAGRNTATWDVLADMDELTGEAVFEVHAYQSTNAKNAIAAAKQKQEEREERLKGIFPLAGFDLSGGFYGVGGSVYWPWVTSRNNRIGSYASYIYGGKDWKDDSVDQYHNFCLGLTATITPHVAVFAAPGFAVVRNKYETKTIHKSAYSDYEYTTTTTSYTSSNRFTAEAGVCFKLLVFTLSVKYAYPSYLGVGIGLDFGWMH